MGHTTRTLHGSGLSGETDPTGRACVCVCVRVRVRVHTHTGGGIYLVETFSMEGWQVQNLQDGPAGWRPRKEVLSESQGFLPAEFLSPQGTPTFSPKPFNCLDAAHPHCGG